MRYTVSCVQGDTTSFTIFIRSSGLGKDQITSIEAEKPYWETGPFEDEDDRTFEFHWTLADILNPLATSGFILRRILESPAEGLKILGGLFVHAGGLTTACWDWNEKPPGSTAGMARASFAEAIGIGE